MSRILTRSPSRAARPPADQPIPGLPSRRAALTLLHGVLALGRPLDQLLGGTLGSLPPADRGLAHAIALGVLRRLPDLDAAIDSATPRSLPADARARTALRIGLAQAWIIGTPRHAVTATTLALLEGGPRRLAHAVLTRLLGAPSPLPVPPTLPEPWADHWRIAYGEPATRAIATALAAEPPLDLTLRDPAETDLWAERLGATSLLPGHLRLDRTGDVTQLAGFTEGAWWVQDLAASLPARLLAPAPGELVLDLCAAPGGKTLQLAAMGARVTAIDIAERRLARVGENLARTGLTAELIVVDARTWEPPAPQGAILLDAPCSATGTARRHPDVLHLKAARDFASVLELQAALLARAARWLMPGGRLIYCTCSLEPEEGEAHIARLLAADPAMRVCPIGDVTLPNSLAPASEGWLRTLPGQIEGGLDGFFIARLVRA